MPYDHEHLGGGRPEDPRHKPIYMVALAGMDALGRVGKAQGLCMDCLALQTAGMALAVLLIQQGAVSLDTGNPEPEKVESLLQAVIDIAMKEAADTARARKERG